MHCPIASSFTSASHNNSSYYTSYTNSNVNVTLVHNTNDWLTRAINTMRVCWIKNIFQSHAILLHLFQYCLWDRPKHHPTMPLLDMT